MTVRKLKGAVGTIGLLSGLGVGIFTGIGIESSARTRTQTHMLAAGGATCPVGAERNAFSTQDDEGNSKVAVVCADGSVYFHNVP